MIAQINALVNIIAYFSEDKQKSASFGWCFFGVPQGWSFEARI